MQIREIHIDGFGIFTDKHLTGLTSGINVIYGPNEFGKTTLLDFIRRILFGFPRISTSTNPYPAVHGGAYGGRMICELDSGEKIIISRAEGVRGGSVAISTGSGELSGKNNLDNVVGHITEKFYKNVYAISLDELQEIQSLQGEDIRNRIYGAGLGLGSISLVAVKNEFTKQGESFYKPQGSVQKMPSLFKEIRDLEREIKEVQKDLGKYDDLVQQHDRLIKNITALDCQIRELESKQRALENKRNLYPTYLELSDAESELSQLEELPQFMEDALEKLEERKRELTALKGQLDEKSDGIKGLELKMDALIYNEQIIEREPDVVSLQRLSGKYESAIRDIGSVKDASATRAGQIRKKIKEIGQEWTDNIIRDFTLSHLQKDKMLSYKESINEASETVDGASSKLEYHRERKLGESPKGFGGPDFYRYAVYCMAGIGLAGGIWGWLSSEWALAGVSAIILIIGLSVAIRIWRGNRIELKDPLEKEFDEKLREAESQRHRLEDEWHDFLRDINFNENLSPDGALEVVRAIENIQSDLSSLAELHARIKHIQNTIDEVKELHDRVIPCLDRSAVSGDIVANIEIFMQHLNVAKDTKRVKEDFSKRIDELTAKINDLKEKKETAEKEIQQYVSSLGAIDEEDFRTKYKVFTRRIELRGKIDEAKRIIQSTIGRGEHYDNFIESISATNPEEIAFQLNETDIQLKELKSERDQKKEDIGKLRNEIERLSSSEDLLVKQGEVELKKQQLRDYSREWVKSQIPLFALEKAISKYENTRQPGVIKAAEDVFSSITNNAYPAIIKPIDSDELRIRDSLGFNKSIIEMSRGTKEQLYLAMRLGLIKEYETRSESMPIIMDDVLANFDDARGPLAVKALEEFSKDRQIIVLTCHKNTLDMYKQLGAKDIIPTLV
ncbi:MAG: AAA family ATPase [Dehalococcoidia bacterium]|nr:AAA family ATPase [Dehalococcoidia bacterium]